MPASLLYTFMASMHQNYMRESRNLTLKYLWKFLFVVETFNFHIFLLTISLTLHLFI